MTNKTYTQAEVNEAAEYGMTPEQYEEAKAKAAAAAARRNAYWKSVSEQTEEEKAKAAERKEAGKRAYTKTKRDRAAKRLR